MAEGEPPPRVVWTRDGARWDEEMDPGAESSQRRNTLVTTISTHIYTYLNIYAGGVAPAPGARQQQVAVFGRDGAHPAGGWIS